MISYYKSMFFLIIINDYYDLRFIFIMILFLKHWQALTSKYIIQTHILYVICKR